MGGGAAPLTVQVVLRSTLPLNLYFTNAIFTVWLPDNIPYVKKVRLFKKKTLKKKKNVLTYCKKVVKWIGCYMNTSVRLY